MDVEHARAIADLMERQLRVRPTVATSDDPRASARIARFAASSDEWIVAVRMVSEGVDIPRLRVGVFATNTTTELFFRQALGRLVRWTRGLRTQRAWMYIPDDPRLRRLAEGIAEQRRHSLFQRARPDDEFEPDTGAEFDAIADEGDEEQLSLFEARSAVVTGMEGVDDSDEADDAASGEELVWDGGDEDESLEVSFPPRQGRPGSAAQGRAATATLAESKSELRRRNSDLVAHLVAISGRSHREINGELNRLSGIRKVTEATAAQLARRLEAGEQCAKQL